MYMGVQLPADFDWKSFRESCITQGDGTSVSQDDIDAVLEWQKQVDQAGPALP